MVLASCVGAAVAGGVGADAHAAQQSIPCSLGQCTWGGGRYAPGSYNAPNVFKTRYKTNAMSWFGPSGEWIGLMYCWSGAHGCTSVDYSGYVGYYRDSRSAHSFNGQKVEPFCGAYYGNSRTISVNYCQATY
jgi:hypothetical protein